MTTIKITDEQIVDAVNAAHARGRIALTFFNLEGVEKPTDVARSFARELLAAQSGINPTSPPAK